MNILKGIKNLIWRTQFKKVKISNSDWERGRCIKCEAGEPAGAAECGKYYCPCKYNEQLKRVAYYGWLYKK